MSLLDRVATLIRANLTDLIERAEDPEKLLKQVIVDMQNQLLQLKTQVAIAIADLHGLERRQKENQAAADEWERKANMALDRHQEELARAAVERSLSYRNLHAGFEQQIGAQQSKVESLKAALSQLTEKLKEAEAKVELLIAQHRRARTARRAEEVTQFGSEGSAAASWQRMQDKVRHAEAMAHGFAADPIEAKFAEMERNEAVDKLLSELKARRK